MFICNICGNNKFGLGPGNRRSFDGISLPRCTKCQSLERHRALRDFWLKLPLSFLGKKTVLQFSDDKSIEPNWFLKFEVSIFGGKNSIDIQNIEYHDGSFDIVICNHVIEHVPNDKIALREIYRVSSENGFVALSVPDPFHRKHTIDWGYPKIEEHGHYRIYGEDFNELLSMIFGYENYLRLVIQDPVTKSKDFLFLISKNNDLLSTLYELNQISSKLEDFC